MEQKELEDGDGKEVPTCRNEPKFCNEEVGRGREDLDEEGVAEPEEEEEVGVTEEPATPVSSGHRTHFPRRLPDPVPVKEVHRSGRWVRDPPRKRADESTSKVRLCWGSLTLRMTSVLSPLRIKRR